MAFTELGERASFYGLQAILPFYLLYSLAEGGLHMDKAVAAGIIGAYGGSVYIAQIVGAWLGDRVIPPQQMVLYGAIVIMVGHVMLAAVPAVAGLGIGLCLIVLGTGALKTNITSIVGFVLDEERAEARDVGFSYFYMAINVGAVIGPVSTGFLQNRYGFHWGFALAAIGMAFALVQYLRSRGALPQRARIVNNPLPSQRYPVIAGGAVAVIAAVAVGVVAGAINEHNAATVVTVVALVIAVAYFTAMLTSRRVSRTEKRQLTGYIPLFIAASIYFGLLFQKFTAISILITERVDRQVGAWEFPIAWITTTSPLALVLISPLIASLWERMGARQPSPATKFAIGMTQIGCAYTFILALSSVTGDANIPLLLVLLFMALAGSSEVFVGPIGLSLVTRIGPAPFRSQLVALNFLTLAVGSSLSGLLGQYFTTVANSTYFVTVALIGLATGALLFVVRKPIMTLIAT